MGVQSVKRRRKKRNMNEISAEWLKIFAFFGIVCFAGVVGFMGFNFIGWLKDRIEEAKHNQRIKHRFDGKPIAKCWCRDCRMHNNKSGSCSLPGIGRHTPDNGFCYEADPIWKERNDHEQ